VSPIPKVVPPILKGHLIVIYSSDCGNNLSKTMTRVRRTRIPNVKSMGNIRERSPAAEDNYYPDHRDHTGNIAYGQVILLVFLLGLPKFD